VDIPVALSDVLATQRLQKRKSAKSLHDQVVSANSKLMYAQSLGRKSILSVLAREAAAMCRSHSAGVSLFTSRECDELRWEIIYGDLSEFSGRRFPIRHSMCGVCLTSREPQMFIRPQQYFRWMSDNGVRPVEALVVPLRGNGNDVYGTLWVTVRDNTAAFAQDHVNSLLAIGQQATACLRSLDKVEPSHNEHARAAIDGDRSTLFCERRCISRNLVDLLDCDDSVRPTPPAAWCLARPGACHRSF
jgi:hypothetical protein